MYIRLRLDSFLSHTRDQARVYFLLTYREREREQKSVSGFYPNGTGPGLGRYPPLIASSKTILSAQLRATFTPTSQLRSALHTVYSYICCVA
jgi:hypothetical protein